MRIPLLIEPAFARASIWCEQIRAGMEAHAARKKYDIMPLDAGRYDSLDYDALFGDGPRLLVLIGTSASWVPRALRVLAERRVDVLLACYQPPDNTPLRGLVRMDYASGMAMLMDYLRGLGRGRTAFYGCCDNSSTDWVKREAYARYLRAEAQPASIFRNNETLAACYRSFRPHIRSFDSVVCANDFAAASLISHLRRDGASVPGDLYVAAFGSMELSSLFQPSITTVSLDHLSVGHQIVSLYAYLLRNEADISVTVRVQCRLTVRESTASCPMPEATAMARAYEPPEGKDFYRDDEVRALTTLETLLLQCDAWDRAILRGLLRHIPYEALAERLDMPVPTLRYRIRRMAKAAGEKTRNGLVSFMENNGFSWIWGDEP